MGVADKNYVVKSLMTDLLGMGDVRVLPANVSGTILSALKVNPVASKAVAGINYHKLVSIGDETGTTAFGFGDPTKPTTGLMGCFGRTVAATSAVTDTAADFRVINKLNNTGGNTLQAAYLKAKNYSTGTLANLIGLFIEAVNTGTVTGKTIVLKLGKDDGTVDADVLFTNGTYFVASTGAITAGATVTTAPDDSFTVQGGKIYVAKTGKWEYAGNS